MTDYRAIPCAEHERLELAALRRQWLEVAVDQGEPRGRRRMLPLDVYTRDGAEWLRARTETGETLTLRLDRLRF